MTDYFRFARTLVRGADERPKPNEDRLEEYQEAKLPAVTQSLFSTAPIDDEFEIFKLTWSLTKLRETLGPDHAFTRKVLGQESPAELAKRLVTGHEAARPGRPQAALGGRQGRGGRLAGPHDRLRPRRRPGLPRGPQDVRGRDRVGGEEGIGDHRPGPLRGGGHLRLPRRDVHAASQLRHGQGLDRGQEGGAALHHPGRGLRAQHRPRALRAPEELARGEAAAGARRPSSTSWPPPTSSAATPARRWWTGTAGSSGWCSTGTSGRWAGTTASTRS